MTAPASLRPNRHPRRRRPRARDPRLFSFSGRVERKGYMALQIMSALLFIAAIAFIMMSIRAGEGVTGTGAPTLRLELAGWAIGGAVGAMVASVLIGAGAVTRRARDGALPAIFIGLFYVVNRLLLPVNIGSLGPPGVREIALHFAFIMVVVQILLLVRGTVPEPAEAKDRPSRRSHERP